MQKVKVISMSAQAGIKSIGEAERKYIFILLVSILAFSVLSYIYAINSIAKNTALRVSLEEEVGEVASEISKLEFEYISLKNAVTLELALAYGFEEKNPQYISRSARGLTWNRQ
jgi:cell division protein FtsB